MGLSATIRGALTEAWGMTLFLRDLVAERSLRVVGLDRVTARFVPHSVSTQRAEELEAGLRSKDVLIVDEALSHLGAVHSGIERRTLDVATELLTHDDDELRQDAAFAVGLHWRHEPAFAILLERARVERAEPTLKTVIAALGWYARCDASKRPPVESALRDVISNDARSAELRRDADAALRALSESLRAP